MKVRVRNFQSLEDVSVEVEGFTVVTGRSNLGKSALIRAIAGCFFGFPGDHYVRLGEDQSGVAISVDGRTIKWRKVAAGKTTTTRNTSLEVDGTTYTKLGRDHATLTESLGLREIKTSTVRLRPQIASQHDPIFLIGESETVVAEVFKLLGRVDVVTEAQKMAKKACKEVQARSIVRKEDREAALKAVMDLESVPALREAWDNLQAELTDRLLASEVKQELVRNLRRYQQLQSTPVPRAPVVKQPKQLSIRTTASRWLSLQAREVPEFRGSVRVPEGAVTISILQRYKVLRPVLVPTVPESKDFKPSLELRDCISTYLQKGVEEQFLLTQSNLLLKEQGGLLQRKREMEKELGICPLCNRSFEVENA